METNSPEKKARACRNCGGKTIISEVKYSYKGDSFVHAKIRCRSCGAWCGGITIPKKKEQ